MARSKIALIVLESPWFTPEKNPKRASVLPFFQGLERLMDNVNVYYSTFYELHGFKAALENDLTLTREKRQILYIGAHGDRTIIGSNRASTILDRVADHSDKIEGLIVSSCMVGLKEDNFWNAMFGKGVHWVFGYRSAVDWMGSTLLEVAILERLCQTRNDYITRKKSIIEPFVEALEKFNPEWLFGMDDCDDDACLRDSIVLYAEAKRRGPKEPYDVTDDLFDALEWWDEDDNE